MGLMPKKHDLPPYFAVKVVSAQEMARVEKLAVEDGCSEEAFISEAGKRVAAAALSLIEEMRLPKHVYLLIGKGNKGADAYAAGIALLEEGIRATAYVCFPSAKCSEFNRKKGAEFAKRRGQAVSCHETGAPIRFEEGLIIDGLLGTGFRGAPEGMAEAAIRIANESKLPILAIDLPSGLDGTTGELPGACVQAFETVTLGMAKSGLFLRNGWNHAGRLRIEPFGLPERFMDQASEIAYLPDPARLLLPKVVRNRHKYQAGYVVGYAGSDTMRGAPKMAGLAALRAGAGIVRVFHKGGIGDGPMEVLFQKWSEKEWKRELARADAVFAGPGLGRGAKIKGVRLPLVCDADLLQKNGVFPKDAVLTPHRGEMLRMLGLKSAPQEEEFLARCQKFAERHHAALILKGGPTWIFSHGKPPLIIPRGDPGMATAGAGDVLTGIVAALLAQKLSSLDAAATGAYLHAAAGEEAAAAKTSYGLIARDLIECLPAAFRELERDILRAVRFE